MYVHLKNISRFKTEHLKLYDYVSIVDFCYLIVSVNIAKSSIQRNSSELKDNAGILKIFI